MSNLHKIQAWLKQNSIDVFIVPRTDEFLNEYIAEYAERVKWITGFSGSAGKVIVEQNKAVKDYNEKDVKEYMKWDLIDIEVNLNIGNALYTVYTCDFTHDYIDINADYRS